MSFESFLPWRPRRCKPPQATCAGPSCEGPSLHRGLRPVRAVKDRVGTWETSGRPQPQGGPGSVREGEEPKPDRKVGGVGRLHSTDEASNNVGRRADGGERGGKAAGRRKGEGQRMPRTQSRTRHVPDGLSPRIGTGAQAPNASDLRQEPGADTEGAAKQKAARRDLRGGREVTPAPTATL